MLGAIILFVLSDPQLTSPVSSPGVLPPPLPVVTTDRRVAKLVRGEYVSGAVRQVSEQISCSVPAATIPPGYTLRYYEWAGDPVLDFGSSIHTSRPSSTAIAHAPGKFTVTCDAVIYREGDGLETKINLCVSKPVYVIGGPLKPIVISPQGYSDFLQWRDQPHGTNDDLTNMAGYLQYFGFDATMETPQGAQEPNTGMVTVSLSQPQGTTYEWQPFGSVGLKGTTSPASKTVLIASTGSGGIAGSGVHCIYHFTAPDEPAITGQTQDDSDYTPPPGAQVTKPNYYRYTVHTPSSLIPYTDENNQTVTYPPNGPLWVGGVIGCGYEMLLNDTNDDPMRWTWIQERFPTTPSGVVVNSDLWWITGDNGRLHSQSNQPSIDYLSRAFDSVSAHTYEEYPSDPGDECLQYYYAGTSTPLLSGPGILVGVYLNKFWSNTIVREQKPVRLP